MELCCCAIISHHPKRFKWKYKESNNGCKRLKKRLNGQIVALYADSSWAAGLAWINGQEK